MRYRFTERRANAASGRGPDRCSTTASSSARISFGATAAGLSATPATGRISAAAAANIWLSASPTALGVPSASTVVRLSTAAPRI
jgi:hypothetical protein